MSKATTVTGVGLICLAATSALCLFTATAQEGGENRPDEQPSSIVGTWQNSVRHAVHSHLYQPVHGARDRDESFVHFELQEDRLTGYSTSPGHEREGWNEEGRTDFRDVKFVKGQLVFEFDIDTLHHGRRHQMKSKAWVRVEAQLNGDRLLGKWGIFEKTSGNELFRGEWEAVRTKEPEKKLSPRGA